MLASILHKLTQFQPRERGAPEPLVPDLPLERLRYEQAREWPEISGAFRLLHDCYARRGLITPTPRGLRYTHLNLLPTSATFLAKHRDQVVATFSLVVDTAPFGLPMDVLYAAELAPLRAQGRRVAEISGLAVDPPYQPIGVHLVFNLVRILYRYARKVDVSDLVLACHPRHARFYQRVFLFTPLGERRSYRAVNDAPAVAVRLDLTDLEARYRRSSNDAHADLYRFLFTDEVLRCPETPVQAAPLSRSVLRRLCALQPETAAALEEGQPGLLGTLTGDPAPARSPAPAAGAAPRGIPVFVPT